MTRKGIPFSKLNGSGNDFLLIDDRGDAMRGIDRPSFVAKVCDRSRSIGADGVIVIERDRSQTFATKEGRSTPRIASPWLSIRRKSLPLPFSLEKGIPFRVIAPPSPLHLRIS